MSWSHTPSIVPATYPRSERPHTCGRCRTPWGVSNPACINAQKEVRDVHRDGGFARKMGGLLMEIRLTRRQRGGLMSGTNQEVSLQPKV